MVSLYPQSHHPALATEPLILQSHNMSEDLHHDFDTDGHLLGHGDENHLNPLSGKTSGDRMYDDSGNEITDGEVKSWTLGVQATRAALRRPFGNPLDALNTTVLFPVPQDM